MLPYATRVGRLLDEARRAARDDGMPAGRLCIGSLETTAALRLPPVLTAFAGAHPDVDLVLTTGTTSELIDDVLEQRVEGAFVCGPVHHPDLEEEVVFREEMVLVTARSVRTLDDLTGRADLKIVVLRAGCSYRQRLEAMLAARGVVGARRLEFGTIEGILGCVAAGLGVTLLPKGVVGQALHHARLTAHELPGADARVDTVFVRRRDAFVSSALAAFQQTARACRVKPPPRVKSPVPLRRAKGTVSRKQMAAIV